MKEAIFFNCWHTSIISGFVSLNPTIVQLKNENKNNSWRCNKTYHSPRRSSSRPEEKKPPVRQGCWREIFCMSGNFCAYNIKVACMKVYGKEGWQKKAEGLEDDILSGLIMWLHLQNNRGSQPLNRMRTGICFKFTWQGLQMSLNAVLAVLTSTEMQDVSSSPLKVCCQPREASFVLEPHINCQTDGKFANLQKISISVHHTIILLLAWFWIN